MKDQGPLQVIREQKETIRLLTDLTKAGSWTLYFKPGGELDKVRWGNGFRRLMGYTDETDFPNELDPFVNGIVPEDRDSFLKNMTAIVTGVREKDDGFEFRFVRRDGIVRWYRSLGRLERTGEGRPERFHGVTIDITEIKQHDQLLADFRMEAEFLNTIHEMLGSGRWSMDFETSGAMARVSWSNEFRRMIGYSSPEDFPDTLNAWSDKLHPRDRDRVLKEFFDTIVDYTGRKTYDVEYQLLTKEKGYRWFRAVGKPTRRPDGTPITYVGIFIDITEQKEMAQRLAQQQEYLNAALEQANQANKAKTAFLSNMSHEIRTPMNAIIGLDSIALNDPSLTPAVRDYLEKIGASAHHLLGIINDILDMSRIESGRMMIKQEEFSFAKALAQVNTIISGQCRDKGLHYECQVKGTVDDFYIGDDMKLRQVMINILGNAVKFTPEGGRVSLVVEEQARYEGKCTLRFEMKDTGIGMAPEFLPKLFDAFSQEDSSNTSKYGSTGLGMPITKSIVELMNGTITVESEKGKGTVFYVTLTFLEAEHRQEGEAGEILPQEMCVLVIDDDPIACEHAQVVLSQVGVSCEKALSGEEGLKMIRLRDARREPYNLILVDWKMPEMDGVETTRQIRKLAGEDTPVIILTSYSWDDICEEAREAGVDTFVAKPLFAGTVLEEFREAFEKKNARQVKESASLTGKRILLAEDIEVNAEIMMMVLSMREMEVDHALNGLICVEMFEKSQIGYYDAILMDMRMPEMDGLEATQRIRSLPREDAKAIPIIALTANAFDQDVQRSMQAGLNAHLSKPIEPELLFKTLEGLLR